MPNRTRRIKIPQHKEEQWQSESLKKRTGEISSRGVDDRHVQGNRGKRDRRPQTFFSESSGTVGKLKKETQRKTKRKEKQKGLWTSVGRRAYSDERTPRRRGKRNSRAMRTRMTPQQLVSFLGGSPRLSERSQFSEKTRGQTPDGLSTIDEAGPQPEDGKVAERERPLRWEETVATPGSGYISLGVSPCRTEEQ